MICRAAALALLGSLALACSSSRPVLYPNAHLQDMGSEVARYDVDRCIEFARRFAGRGSKTGEAAEDAARDAVRGGAVGAAAGAVWGRPGRAAGAAAAGAATNSAVRSVFRARDLDPIERRFAETCLQELGYQPVGWR